jgi:hypothetical protein
MNWTDPRTWAIDDEITEDRLNSYVRDNLLALGNDRPSVSVYQNATTSVANTLFSSTEVLFGDELYDTDGFHSTSVDTGRLTVPTGLEGYYLITANLTFAANATNVRAAIVQRQPTTPVNIALVTTFAHTGAGEVTSISLSAIDYFNATDYVRLFALQNSGGALNTSGDYRTWLAMTWLGRDPF